jgi:hypothetical protein
MDAMTAANNAFELQRNLFIFGDIKSEMLTAFRTGAEAIVYTEEDEEASYGILDLGEASVYDDKMSGAFKVGDNFQCAIKESRTEKWFQIKYNKNIINLRHPEKYFKREEEGVDYFIFVAFTSVSVVMINQSTLGFTKAKSLLKKITRSIIGYDKHGQVFVKRGVK